MKKKSLKIQKEKEQGRIHGYLVACGWAGAVFELLKHLGKSSEAKDRKNIKKSKMGTDRPTDQPTNRPTDRYSGV